MIDAAEAGRRYAYWNSAQDPTDAFYEWENAELSQQEADQMTPEQFRALKARFESAYRSEARRSA